MVVGAHSSAPGGAGAPVLTEDAPATRGDDRTPGWRRVPSALLGWLRLDLGGVIGAYLFFCVSLTPSLVPRMWIAQAVLSGITVAIGYAVGSLAGWAVRLVAHGISRFTRAGWSPSRRLVLASWWSVATVGTTVSAGYLLASSSWQTELSELVEREVPGPNHYVLTLVIAAGLFLGLLALARGLRGTARWLRRILGRRVPLPVAASSSVVVVSAVTFWAWTGLLYPFMMQVANNVFEAINETTSETSVEPTSELRSGGPGSLVSWDSLGRKGREFIGSGPSAAEIAEFTGQPAMEPVRAYIGMEAAEDLDERAELAVRELERAGGFERAVLVVATTTGTGWIDPAAADSLEYLHSGDTAIVGIQYSYLPSWLSFLVDDAEAENAGAALLEAVRQRWLQLPVGSRPHLVAYGESLGAMGSTGAFEDLGDVLDRVDAALWVGTPDSSDLHRELTDARDPGSRYVQPVVDEGRSVRFWSADGDSQLVGRSWDRPRALFLQHGSDPVVWWSPSLIYSKPAWLSEPLADDVLPSLSWFPFVTFWQVAGDMAVAAQVPDGYGHRYAAEHVDAWLALAPPEDWPAERTEPLREMLRSYCPLATTVISVVGTC